MIVLHLPIGADSYIINIIHKVQQKLGEVCSAAATNMKAPQNVLLPTSGLLE